MTRFEQLKNKENECIEKAIAATDENMKRFFYSAAIGYEIKISKLTVKEAKEQV